MAQRARWSLQAPQHSTGKRDPGMNREPDTCDYLIIGGGSSGCALASRLSEDSANRVILVELDGTSMARLSRRRYADAQVQDAQRPAVLWPNLTAHTHETDRPVCRWPSSDLGWRFFGERYACTRGLPGL